MKALVADSYGPVEQLTISDVPKPAPGKGQVLLKVRAAGLNKLDVRLTVGEYREQMPVEHPFVPGLDAAGVVEAVGEGVTRFAPGDEVVAFTYPFFGAVAEYALASDGPNLVRRPAELPPERAAALPVAAGTAFGALDAAQLKPGESVLIVGAAGGVGSFLVQLAAQADVRVLATGRPDDAEYLRGLGAQVVIDYTAGRAVEETLGHLPGGADVVIDLINAGPALTTYAAAVKPGGTLVSPLGGPPEFDRGVTASYVGVENGIGRLEEIVKRSAEGRLGGDITTYPFSEAARAAADYAGQHTRGKVVIVS